MPARNVAELVRSAAGSSPDKIALVDGDRTLTWAELDRLVDRAADGFLASGRAVGDRLGILLPNCIEFVVAYFGALRAGLVAVPFNTVYTTAELAFQIEDADVALTVTDSAHASKLPALDGVAVLVDGPDAGWESLLASGRRGSADGGKSAAGGEDLAALLYTSGTTGRPRGAMLSHRALLANLDQLMAIDPPVVAPDDRVLLVLPLFHVYGLNTGLGMVARAASTAVLARRFDPTETLALVRDEQVSCIVGAPPIYVAWAMVPDLGESLTSVRLALSGAAPMPPSVLSAVLDATGHHIFEGYGLTETAPVLASTLCSPVAKPGSVGRAIPGVEITILNAAEDGDEADESEAEDNDPGEVVVRGANLFSGYWPQGEGGPDADGWFRTGDIAYADADGDLHLVDRTKELIIVSGFNVYPREVEDVLRDHYAVSEVAVLGVPHPYTGETVKALVVLRSGATPDAQALIDHVAARLARFKGPTIVEFVDWLPLSLTGKVAKGRLGLREAGSAETPSSTETPPSPETPSSATSGA